VGHPATNDVDGTDEEIMATGYEAGKTLVRGFWVVVIGGLMVLGLVLWGGPVYGRYQTRANEANKIQVNELLIQQTEQLVQVEKQKAQIRVVEAQGIAQSQQIINATLTDRYLHSMRRFRLNSRWRTARIIRRFTFRAAITEFRW
jgi:hypothetical protein